MSRPSQPLYTPRRRHATVPVPASEGGALSSVPIRAAACAAAVLGLAVAAAPPTLAHPRDRDDDGRGKTLRFATFNASVNRNTDGGLMQELSNGDDPQLRNVAEIIQRARPDVLLINEFDFVPDQQAARLFQRNYLSVSQNGARAIEFPYRFVAPSNTGIASGKDLDNNGQSSPSRVGPVRQRLVRLRRVPGQVRHGGLLAPADRLQARPHLPALPVEGHARRPASGRPRDTRPAVWYSPDELDVFRLSSKSHWDLPIKTGHGERVHFLVSHPTPPGVRRPRGPQRQAQPRRDPLLGRLRQPRRERLHLRRPRRRAASAAASSFVIAGDQNADPFDGDSAEFAIQQLLDTRGSTRVTPTSPGGPEQAALQGGSNTATSATRPSTPRTSRTARPATCAPTTCCRARHRDRARLRVLAAERPPLFRLVGTFHPALLPDGNGFP